MAETTQCPEITESDLLKLVVGNVKFSALKEELSAFNPFKVLRLSEYEIRHSNMLAWLFDPQESHSFSDLILKTFFFEVCNENSVLLTDGILTNVYKFGLDDALVIREQKVSGGFIDLLIVSEQCKLVLVIENKFRAKESDGQLVLYREYAKATYPEYKIFPIFLTLEGEEPSDGDYAVFSYEKLVTVVGSALQIKQTQMSDEMYRFVKYYLNVLREELGMNEDVKKLCKQIYRDHRDVIDKIYEIGNAYTFEQPVEAFMRQHHLDRELCVIRSGIFAFVERAMATPGTKVCAKWTRGDYAVSYWFYFNTTLSKIEFVLEVGPFNNAIKRISFLESINKKIGEGKTIRIKEGGGSYTRLFSKNENKFDQWSSPDEILVRMNQLYDDEKLRGIRGKLIEAITEFDWTGA